ncbi:hypothetical protein GALMADRAFT_243359 [Galerina marginata CBS 339.88]|uniref:Uncharacterized protein n=1 Tax=Galerina marginata (strain CBS 339.88) TaxID=685588 RepID=A0A067T889_GALM3|nr:hypothetical protein GALMADRAFT_243359 [Galerina marginata CBS 339.88]
MKSAARNPILQLHLLGHVHVLGHPTRVYSTGAVGPLRANSNFEHNCNIASAPALSGYPRFSYRIQNRSKQQPDPLLLYSLLSRLSLEIFFISIGGIYLALGIGS